MLLRSQRLSGTADCFWFNLLLDGFIKKRPLFCTRRFGGNLRLWKHVCFCEINRPLCSNSDRLRQCFHWLWHHLKGKLAKFSFHIVSRLLWLGKPRRLSLSLVKTIGMFYSQEKMLRTKLLIAWAEKLLCVYIEMLVHLLRFLSQSSGVSFRKDVDWPIKISLYNDKFRQGEANSNLAWLKVPKARTLQCRVLRIFVVDSVALGVDSFVHVSCEDGYWLNSRDSRRCYVLKHGTVSKQLLVTGIGNQMISSHSAILHKYVLLQFCYSLKNLFVLIYTTLHKK